MALFTLCTGAGTTVTPDAERDVLFAPVSSPMVVKSGPPVPIPLVGGLSAP